MVTLKKATIQFKQEPGMVAAQIATRLTNDAAGNLEAMSQDFFQT